MIGFHKKLMRENGDSYQTIVDWLNQNRHVTRTGKPFTDSALCDVIHRYLGDSLRETLAHAS